MKILTKIDLKDFLDKDFAWRKFELTQILTSVKMSSGRIEKLAIRTAILLLYAHWEGFIKQAAQSYLNYVKNKALTYKNLKNCFVALSLKQKLLEFETTNKATIHTQLIDYLETCSNEIAIINDVNVIKTGSNLKSTILKEILTTLGLDYSPFDLKANLIDEQLLNYRNTIAHGEFLNVTPADYKLLHEEIFQMMTLVKTEIENAAALSSYKV